MAKRPAILKRIVEEFGKKPAPESPYVIQIHKEYKGPAWGDAYERGFFVRLAIHGNIHAARVKSGVNGVWLKEKREKHGERWYEEEEFCKGLYHARDLGLIDKAIHEDGDAEMLRFKAKHVHPDFKAKDVGNDEAPLVVKFHPAEFGKSEAAPKDGEE